jgi:hypothetical protein
MIYTPQFSEKNSVSVKRLSWLFNLPMTKTVDLMVRLIPSIIDPAKVCLSCKDKTSCSNCIFCNPPTKQETTEILSAL